MSERASPQPSRIGPYKILDCLGEGGMGTVYLAEQKEPVQRKVALKVIKLGMDSKAVVARFEQERQALALMQHDGIAKVYDCGTTESGQPFFAMEYVKGVPLVDYCDQHKLPLEQRIELLQQVCSAVQHAHQKGVVHRDLKPGNVLVDDQGGKPQAKVIDFGLAKTMGQKLGEKTLFTERGVLVGTLEYMAPEQADATNADIDTRADVYSLGVMVYETLTGQLPFSRQELLAAGEAEMRRILREEDPEKPSAKLSGLRDSANAVAAQRQTSFGALHKALAVDLDWLVLKALEKDRNRRYATANALSMDLQRYLDHEPLQAGPPSASYRLGKLARRYRVQLTTAGFVFAASIAFGGVAAVQHANAKRQAGVADRQREVAERSSAAAAEAQASASRLAEEKGRIVSQFQLLAGIVRLQDAVAAQEQLWLLENDTAGWPAKIEALQSWLDGPCAQLLAQRKKIEATLEELRSQSLPLTPEQAAADRRAAPSFAAWQRQSNLVDALRRATAIRDGSLELQEVPLPSRFVDSTPPEELNEFAWPRIAPEDLDQGRDRTIFGEEMVALTAARAAVSRSMASPDRHAYLDTLAWALFANGQDEDAQARSAEALAAAPPGSRAEYERYQQTLTRAIAQRKASLQSAEQRLLQLDRECATRRTWSFTRNEEGEAARFLHDALVGHLRELEKLEGRRRTDVARRLSWARQVGAASASHPLARHSWAEARAAIHAADGTTASRLYASKHIPIPDSGWHGLVPIGRNPATGLWEFYDLRSAWDGEQKIAEIEIPKHAEDGSIQVRADTGIVFVLVPGGSFWMGSQQDDPQAPNYDPERAPSETLHEVALSPYLLARHELTRSQWTRLTDEPAGYWEDGVRYNGDATPIGPTHPAVEIDWFRADLWLRRHAMCLPTEAQWEHGCRAGTTTVFSSGSSPSSLQGYANVHDLTSNEQFSRWGEPAPIRDGYRAISPVGSYLANQFGMHDMHGNVWEWCQDLEGRYGSERPGDGLRTTSSSSERIDRGGSYNFPPMHARSAHRTEMSPASRINILGLRACRLLPP